MKTKRINFEKDFIESQLMRLFGKLKNYCQKHDIDISTVAHPSRFKSKQFPRLHTCFNEWFASCVECVWLLIADVTGQEEALFVAPVSSDRLVCC